MPDSISMNQNRLNLLNVNLKTTIGQTYLKKVQIRLSPLTDDDLVNTAADLQYEFEKAAPIFQALSEYLEEDSNYSEDFSQISSSLMQVLETFPEP